MRWLSGWARLRFVSLWVALSLIGITVAMVLFALSDQQTAAFVRSLTLPGRPEPDTSWLPGGSMALAEAIIAAALGAVVIAFPNRTVFVFSAAWALLAVASGTPTLGYPRLLQIDVGPIALSTSSVAIGLTLLAVSCVAGCVVGWFSSPSESEPLGYMPPPTHQG